MEKKKGDIDNKMVYKKITINEVIVTRNIGTYTDTDGKKIPYDSLKVRKLGQEIGVKLGKEELEAIREALKAQ